MAAAVVGYFRARFGESCPKFLVTLGPLEQVLWASRGPSWVFYIGFFRGFLLVSFWAFFVIRIFRGGYRIFMGGVLLGFVRLAAWLIECWFRGLRVQSACLLSSSHRTKVSPIMRSRCRVSGFCHEFHAGVRRPYVWITRWRVVPNEIYKSSVLHGFSRLPSYADYCTSLLRC